MGVVTRVRFEAEGRDHDDVLEALDAATALLRPFMAETKPSSFTFPVSAGGPAPATVEPSRASMAIGGLRDEDGQVVGTEFVEEVIESRISDGISAMYGEGRPEGAVYYVGRRVLKVVERPLDLREPMR